MNKIYKVIWSKVRNCYVAVSEIAKRNGKSCTSVNCGAKANRGRAGVALAIALSLSMTGGGVAWGSHIQKDSDTTISDATHKSDGYELTKAGTTAGTGVKFTVGSSGEIFYIWSAKNGNTININSGGKVNGSGYTTNWVDGYNSYVGVLGGVNYNVINIDGVVTGNAYGGYSSTESVSHNSVTVNGSNASVGNNVYGGYSAAVAADNTVIVKDGNQKNMVGNLIYGGYSTAGNVERNTVEITDVGRGAQVVVASNYIYGGKTDSGNALKNSVTISNAKVFAVYGGSTDNGDAGANNQGNSVSITNASVHGGVYGGLSDVNHKAVYNTVTIDGSDVKTVSTVYVVGGKGGDASNNSVTIKGNSEVEKDVFGGWAIEYGSVETNHVEISGGTVSGVVSGGLSYRGNAGGNTKAKGNTVTISAGSVTNNVYGGDAPNNDGNAMYNTVKITGGAVGGTSKAIYGGYGRNKAQNNTVSITGGSVTGTVYGGYGYNDIATGNTVIINGGTVTGNVYGGYSYTTNKEVTGNTVELGGVTISGSVFGGYSRYESMVYNNALILTKAGNSVTAIGDDHQRHSFTTIKITDSLIWHSGDTALTSKFDLNAFDVLDISEASKLKNTNNAYGQMTLLSDTDGNLLYTYNNTTTFKLKYNSTSDGVNLSATSPEIVIVPNTGAAKTNLDKGVTLSYKEKEHVVYLDKANTNNYKNLVYAVEDNVTNISFGEMTWGTPRNGSASGTHFGFTGLTNSNITTTGLKFANPQNIAKDATTSLLTNATNLAAGTDIYHTQNFDYQVSNGAVLNATLSGKVLRSTANAISYQASGTQLKSVNLAGWDGTKNPFTTPDTWTVVSGGIPVSGSYSTPNLAAGVTKDIIITEINNAFLDNQINNGIRYSSTALTDDSDKGITFSGTSYSGVKAQNSGKKLTYYAPTKDVTDITLGTITWGDTEGRTAGDLYIFNNVNSIDATGFSFSNPDAVSGSMYLLSNATGLAAGAVADISHTQADFTTNMGNGTAITATLTGTISTAEAGKVKYTATGTTISTIDLSGWDVSTSSVIPTGWSLKKDGSNAVEATVVTANMDATKLSNLPYGSSVPILTASGTNFFDGITINGANAWNGAADIVDADESGVSIVGTSTGTGVKVDSGNKNQIIYQKTKEAITNLRLAGITFEAGKTVPVRSFGNTYDLTAAPIVASDDLFTPESRPLMETGDTMTLVDATGAIKNASNETLAQFNDGSSKSYVVNFTDTIKSNSIIKSDSIKFTGTHTDTLSQEDDTATSTKKSLLKYEVGAKMVTKATLSGAIDWRDGGTYYTNGVDVNENGKDATYTFDGDTAVDIAGVQFSTTEDPIAGGKTKSMTLLKGVTGVVEDKISGTPSFAVALTQNNTKLDAKATGSASVSGNDVVYSVNGVAIDKINVTSIAKAADTVPTGWTLAKDSSDNVIATVETDGLVVASPSGLEPGVTKVIIEAASGSTAFFKDVSVNGSHAWKVDGSTITSDLDIGGVAITGTQTKGGVKVNEANTNQIIYEESKKSINTLTLGSVTFANDDGTAATVARTFDKTYDVSTATINADDLAFINSDIMETGNSMRIVDASAAIPNAISNKKLPTFTKQDKTVNYTDTISGKVITFAGTHTDKLEQDAAQTMLTYTVGDKVVSTATLNGTVNWSDGTSYYTNGSDVNQNNVAATYIFDGNTSVDISNVSFSATADPLAGATKTMTLLKGVTGVVATKVSGTPSFAVTLDQTNTKLDAKATGASGVSGNDVTFTVSGVTLDKITVKSANGTADKVPASWTMAAGATIETDSMTVPELAAGTHVDILQSDTDGFFAKVAINGANAYGNTQDAFTESDAAKSVTIAGTQDKGVTLNTEKKHLIYKAGTLDVASVTLGLAEWKKGATVFDRSGAGYNYAGVAALGTDGFAVSYASPETVATGDSMTLLQANATLKDMAEQVKKTSYSYTPVTGVTIDANITGKLATSGGAVTYTATENQASKLTFTNVDWKDSGALLTRPSNITFAGADVDTAKIHFQNVKELDANRKMTLVSDFGDSVGTITGSKYTVGAGLEGEGAASLSGSDLVFTTKTGARDLAAQEQTHNTLMVMEAGMAVLAAGREHLGQAMVGLADPQNAGSDGTRIGASMGGGWSRYKTGSHVDSNNWNVAVAVGSKRELTKGSLEWGVFGEYGKSNYTLHSDAGRGDGDSHYAGGGLMAKWTNKHDVYTEAGVRLGRLSDTASNLLRDAAGNGYGYDVHANYFGAHVGIGKIIRYKGGKSLDVYGKYFYTKRDGVDFASGGNNYSLDSVASSILRVGARYGTTDKKWNWYGGLAYEYEFDGKSEGTVDGIGIRAASVKGGSVRGEIGMRMSATKTNPWQTDISIYGYGGKHRGFGGSVNVAYMF